MTEETRRRLRDALESLDNIAGFMSGQTIEDYRSSLMLRSAVERQFEIVGEALNYAWRSDPAIGDRIVGLRDVIGLRNRIIHGYDRIDDQLIWDIVQTEAPLLADVIRSVLDKEDGRFDDPARRG
jgi:uncharacterized protein with HEPN domain